MHRGTLLISILAVCANLAPASSKNQEFSDFTTPLPLHAGNTLILGIVGGWERWDAPQRGVRKTALELRGLKLPGVYVETVENHKLVLASELIDRAFPNRKDVRLILYGHSFGGMSAVRLARELQDKGITVLLVVLIDAVGRNHPIPSNVHAAANFFQRGSCPICGPRLISADDLAHTRIIGNFEWKYHHKEVDMGSEPWVRRFFVRDHEKMEFDPEMWSAVKKIIVEAAVPSGPGAK
jgi:pimeloyl-ACP methyl ester carboxylesterase